MGGGRCRRTSQGKNPGKWFSGLWQQATVWVGGRPYIAQSSAKGFTDGDGVVSEKDEGDGEIVLGQACGDGLMGDAQCLPFGVTEQSAGEAWEAMVSQWFLCECVAIGRMEKSRAGLVAMGVLGGPTA